MRDLDQVRAIGQLVFEHAQIGGEFRWDGLTFAKEVKAEIPLLEGGKMTLNHMRWSYAGKINEKIGSNGNGDDSNFGQCAQLVLAHAEIGTALKAYALKAEVDLLIDLRAAKAFTLDDDKSRGGKKPGVQSFPAGWGGMGQGAPKLDLDGFVYQRIANFPSGVNISVLRRPLAAIGAFLLRGDRDIAAPRLQWIACQKLQDKTEFYPQPYRQLAAVLRNHGHVAAARQVAITEANKSCRGWWGILRRCTWGFWFGYGLNPGMAFLTLSLTIITGWILVDNTYQMGAMELVPTELSAAAARLGPWASIPADITDCRPGKTEISPMLYDIDMALPVVPLHQEEKCEVRQENWIRLWLFALFSIFGKLVTTLTLLTFSGVMKPKDE